MRRDMVFEMDQEMVSEHDQCRVPAEWKVTRQIYLLRLGRYAQHQYNKSI